MQVALLLLTALLLGPLAALHAADDGITWLVQYDGAALPDASIWKTQGKVGAKIEDGALHLVDDSNDFGKYRAAWKAEPEQEIVVEAKVEAGAIPGSHIDVAPVK